MPVYEYFCETNGRSVEVRHSMSESIASWGDLCRLAEIPVGDTPADAPVERHLFAAGLSAPKTNSELKSMGFTKLVKREDGVYENVTALDGEKKYMTRGDKDSVPQLHRRIKD
jgi:hypothetical protein